MEFCQGYGLEFDYINENVPENIEKYGNDCRKVYANHYVDDRAQSIEEYIKADYIHKIAMEYGYEPQSRQLIEECAELIQAIKKDVLHLTEIGEKGEMRERVCCNVLGKPRNHR